MITLFAFFVERARFMSPSGDAVSAATLMYARLGGIPVR